MKTIGYLFLAVIASLIVLVGVNAMVQGAEPEHEILPPPAQEQSDFCKGIEMYGGVDAFIDYMNEDNPTPLAPEVEAQVRRQVESCE